MKVRLKSGRVLWAQWVEFWHDIDYISVGIGDDILLFKQADIGKIESE